MHGFLNFGIKILHPKRSAIETNFAQRDYVLARANAGDIGFYSR